MAAWTSLAIALAGAGMQFYGSKKAGDAAKAAGVAMRESANSQADLADYNANVAELQADDAIARGLDEETRFRTRVRGAIGTARTEFAAGNIDVSMGTAADVQADAAYLGELDALTIRTNAGREAWGFKVQAEDLTRRGQIARKEGVYHEAAGRANQSAARWGATGTLLGTGASLLESRYMGRK